MTEFKICDRVVRKSLPGVVGTVYGTVHNGWVYVDWGAEGGAQHTWVENLTHACTDVHSGPPEAADRPSEETPVHDRAPTYEHGDTNPAGLPRMPTAIWLHHGRRAGKWATVTAAAIDKARETDGTIKELCPGVVAVVKRTEQSFDDFLASREQPAGPEIEEGDVVRVVYEGRVTAVLDCGSLVVDCGDIEFSVGPNRCTAIRKKGEL